MISKIEKTTGLYFLFESDALESLFPAERFEDCPPRPSSAHEWKAGGWVKNPALVAVYARIDPSVLL